MEIPDNLAPSSNLFTIALIVCVLLVSTGGCDTVEDSDVSGEGPPSEGDWLISQNEVVDGGPGKDGIPSIDNPAFAPVRDIGYVQDDRLVVGIKVGNDVRAYPHQVLDWHEIVNDEVGGQHIAITYCPLTGTGIGWDSIVDGQATDFGVFGLLFRNNLILYDRDADSNWSQMQLRSVHGEHSGTGIETVQLIETTWETWQELYPDAKVLTTDTGAERNYAGFAYGVHYSRDHSSILFPVQNPDDRLDNKERVHGILPVDPIRLPSAVRVYPISDFGSGVSLVEDTIDEQDYIVVGSSDKNFAAAFKATLPNGARPAFEPVQDALPIALQDEEGNRWDIFGAAVEGPRRGERLTPARSYTGYWFAWADFFPGLEVYDM